MQAQMNSGVAQQPPQRARVLPPSKTTRLAYIDWMRGLACVLMFQTHCYDSWLSPAARKSSSLIIWSQLGGTLPAPLFIFLAGVSFALVTERLREKGVERHAIAKQTILRGAEIFGMGLLFRAQEFALGYPWSPWSDLLRVDVLNILGLSMMLMGVLCWATGDGAMAIARRRTLVGGVLAAAVEWRGFPDALLQSRRWRSRNVRKRRALLCAVRDQSRRRTGQSFCRGRSSLI